MNRTLQLRAWLLAMTVLETRLRAEQGRARNAMIKTAAKFYEDTGHSPGHVFVAHQRRVKGVIEDHYRRTIPVFGKMALRQVKSRRIEVKAAETIYESLVAEWISREALRKATLIAQTDLDDVTGAIAKGLEDGLGTEEIGRRIRKVTQMTPFRAATVARTETHAAATFGSIESVRQAERDLGVVMKKEWLATRDNRTRPEHLAADGQQVAIDEKFSVGGESMDRPGDSGAGPENVVNCLHPDSVIQSGHVQAMTRHWYEGRLVVIETASGNKVATTPNHPILTRGGWVAAAMLKEGDGVIGGIGFEGVALRDLDVKDIKARVEEIYDALTVVRIPMRVTGVRVNFHGDLPNGEVNVIRAAGELRDGLVAALQKPLGHFRLAHADFAQGKLLAQSLLFGARAMEFWRLASDRLMGFCHSGKALIRARIGHTLEHALAFIAGSDAVIGKAKIDMAAVSAQRQRQLLYGLTGKEAGDHFGGVGGTKGSGRDSASVGGAPQFDSSPLEPAMNRLDRDSVFPGKLRKAEASKVFVDKVVTINQSEYSGYVYNLETRKGYYICNGIVQHNCRCAIIYEEKGE